jgi:hypothetical protein
MGFSASCWRLQCLAVGAGRALYPIAAILFGGIAGARPDRGWLTFAVLLTCHRSSQSSCNEGAGGMEAYMPYISLAGSVLSTLATLYFWLVRMRHEQPCLKPYLVDKEFFLGLGRDDVRQIGMKAGIVVANHSVLPNALLRIRLWVRTQEGWQEVERLSFDKQTPQPFNIPPMQTVLLRATGSLSFPYQDALEGDSRTVANYLKTFVVQPVEIKMEMQHLQKRSDAQMLPILTNDNMSAEGAQSRVRAA